MIRKIVVAIVCFASWGLSAQNGTSSPYSYFGLGDLRTTSTIDNQMMGGVSMHADSIHINLKNPAAYSKLRLTTYSAGISQKRSSLKSADANDNASVTNLDYLSIGFPVSSRAAVGFGIMPYSSVGYDLSSTITNTDDTTLTNEYTGDGGLNRAYLSTGYAITDDLSVGVTLNYNFGTINTTRVQSLSTAQYGTLDRRESTVNGFDFNYRMNFSPKLNEKYRVYSTVGFDTQLNLNSENTQTIGSFSRVNGIDVEVYESDLASQGLKSTEIRVPTIITFGLGIGEDLKWFAGAEYSFQDLGDYENDFFDASNVTYSDATSVSIGGYYIPDYSSFTSYLSRVTYRAGVRMSNSGMTVNNEEINDFGITFGTGLPMGRSISNLNIGFEIGKRGTIEAGLIEENYFKINVGLSLNDKWFRKTKIN
ncbi:hypothetical protein H0I23_11925 [Cellulophaga sp. HaHaR_3_176]|uniref:hypothetical protein n=1 Tax=Cellulophaga sp. HaHaR_3_176 TaxID=1942464 RepID=UPI001C1FF540|nr:hypothetical protein [Cellulophaga sp. HaHaR_3_176]QWX83157.1 hypothetical protein H0I23_11925 [Cellulophaga sp. HaHaR_3_176]